MRSGTNCTITSGEVYSWVQEWLLKQRLLKDHGWKCTAAVVFGIVLRAAARSISVSAACRDLSKAPSDQAVMTALDEGLPKTLPVLERRLNEALTGHLPRRMRRREWQVAIDWHLSPYYGQPLKSRNEIYHGKPKQGTSKFHAYASACIVQYGRRYTLALTWVRRHESMVVVLRRLMARIREIGLKIKRILVDRAFFNAAVIEYFQQENLPFLMPVMFRGRHPKKGRKPTGLQWIKRQPAGWYRHAMKKGKKEMAVSVCVGYRRYRDRKTRKQRNQKAAFRRLASAWFSHRNPRTLSQTLRHRNQLSPNAASAHLHLHAQSAFAAVFSGNRLDAPQRMGLDSSDTPCGRNRREDKTSPRMSAIQTHARLDRSRNRRPIPRWLNTLRRFTTINRTWNY